MAIFMQILKDYGVIGLFLILFAYFARRCEFAFRFRYPRSKKQMNPRSARKLP